LASINVFFVVTEASGSALTSGDVNRGFTDAVDSEPLGVASADTEPLGVASPAVDKPKSTIPKSSSVDIPAASAAGSLKTSLLIGKV